MHHSKREAACVAARMQVIMHGSWQQHHCSCSQFSSCAPCLKLNAHLLLQTQESRNIAYVAMTRAERVLYLSYVGSHDNANSFFHEAMLPGDTLVHV